LPELFDEFDEFELDEFEPLPEFDELEPVDELEPLDVFEPEPELADPVPVLAPVLEVEPLECVDALLVEPGSTAATAPAASRLATPTVTVAVFSLRRPRSRSATARETCRAAPWPRGSPLRSSQFSIIAVWHP
jgi:hypothetical protein